MPVATIQKIATIPPGKLKCYITGRLRDATPEEHVRQRVGRSLVEEYGYHKTDIELERQIHLGRDKKRADIVIFEPGTDHSTNAHINLIVEAKRETVKPNHADQGIGQLQSYLAATPNAEFGLWVGSEIRAYNKVVLKGKITFEDILDIPSFGRHIEAPSSFASLVPATEVLKDVFRRCHNYISTNQGGSKEFAFHEFLKITFCKVYESDFLLRQSFILPRRNKRPTLERLRCTTGCQNSLTMWAATMVTYSARTTR
jgi:type I restriction enzyme M protein